MNEKEQFSLGQLSLDLSSCRAPAIHHFPCLPFTLVKVIREETWGPVFLSHQRGLGDAEGADIHMGWAKDCTMRVVTQRSQSWGFMVGGRGS